MNTRGMILAIVLAMFAAGGLFFGSNSTAVGKGKPGGGGNDGGITNPAFSYVEDGAVFVMTVDGSQKLKLTNPKARTDDSSPSWSPDLDSETPGYQGKIAYLNHYDPGKVWSDLFLMNPDGSGKQLVRRFSEPPMPNDPSSRHTRLAWSPNGKEIVFASFLGDALYAVEIQTGNLRLLMDRLPQNEQIFSPTISPMGMMAFTSGIDIYVVDFQLDANGLMQIDPATLVNLTSELPHSGSGNSCWSPDGTRLAFTLSDNLPTGETIKELIVYDALFDEFIIVLEDAGPFGNPSWAPDSSQIVGDALLTTSNGSFNWDLVRITDWADPDRRQIINVTRTDRKHEEFPRWNPGWTDQ